MRTRPLVLLALGGLGVAALFAVQPVFEGVVEADTRVVRAPAPTGGDHDGGDRGGGTLPGTSGTAVGFTVLGGKLYLVTAGDPGAVATYTAAAAKGAPPALRCAAGTTPAPFTAWELRGRGGLPPLAEDGRLLTAPAGGERLACAVTGA
ncbi:hypothetical protein [Saccharothrix obliqua]|uniref:hypothetical protein n=1 Tax=Saccharothrix obliqua TaxID=2861747 RepID=UPI001C5FF941|nr:hypothetical protein [Saccharothrix obliqua]MBW4718102.1 hypothetical protein [Saccharothrix obliqua]